MNPRNTIGAPHHNRPRIASRFPQLVDGDAKPDRSHWSFDESLRTRPARASEAERAIALLRSALHAAGA